MPKVSIVIVAAGLGTRMGQGDKLFFEVAGIPLVGHTWRQFDRFVDASEVIVVARKESHTRFNQLAKTIELTKPWILVDGGAERQDSVWNGVNACDSSADIVAIQDGARPCSPLDLVSQAIGAAYEIGAAVLAKRVTDSLKRGNEQSDILETVIRENLWAVQTPQVFRRDIILTALKKVRDQGITISDDTAACQAIGQQVKLIECNKPNPKATTQADLPFIESLLERNDSVLN